MVVEVDFEAGELRTGLSVWEHFKTSRHYKPHFAHVTTQNLSEGLSTRKRVRGVT
jgi:hypothetical protein